MYTVRHDTLTDSVTCVCKKFKFHGILCRHILWFFTQKNIRTIPDKYVLPWWTKGANRLPGTIAFPEHPYIDFEESETLQYNHLVTMFTRLSVRGAATMAGYKRLLEVAQQQDPIVDKFELVSVSNVVDDTEPTMGSEDDEPIEEDDNDIRSLDPIISQTKGRKRSTRMKSSIEQATQPKKLRRCALCNKMTNHDKQNHYKALGISPGGLQDKEEDDAEDEEEEDAVDL
ncbi:hypothetical protein RJ640_015711 [Escallonia rubra]|uniref:Protein FAR1-RELATED SEQUENCE n=1 Tax=Escallonia rubra TaxID=112253 RepID=A0AA88RKY6_9ASTE|nr:hypothetical protein RJ640_015711 [Escallonia rubra]